MDRLTEEQVIENRGIVEKIIDTFSEPRQCLVKKMFDGPIGEEFFTAPASSKEQYHACFPGGLAAHSINVIKHLHQITDLWAHGKYTNETVCFVGLFHDFGKVGDGTEVMWTPHKSDWHRKQGNLYEVNPKCVFMPVPERGLFILQKFGISLSTDEYLAIRLHDGMHDETNRRYSMKEPGLAILTHMADRWACYSEKS